MMGLCTLAGCERNIDCVFMLDQSGSVGEDNHDLAKRFIENVVTFFSISATQTRVGFVSYSTRSRIEFDLDRYTRLSRLQNAIRGIPYRGGWTATALALNTTNDLLDPANNFGARPSAEGIPKIAILITGIYLTACLIKVIISNYSRESS